MLTKNMSDEDADTFAFMFARLNATHEEVKRCNDINSIDFELERSQRVDHLCVEAEELHVAAFGFLRNVQNAMLEAKLSL